MADPGTTLSLTSSAPAAVVQSIAGRTFVVGPGSAGPLNSVIEINKLPDIALAGFGPGPSLAGEVYLEAAANLKESGLPVFLVRSRTTTPSVLDTPVKTAVKAASVLDYGQIKLAGADQNGDLFLQAKDTGVSLKVQSGMALGYSLSGKAITLTVPAATPASDVVTYWTGIAALLALASITAHGTGASNAGTSLSTTSFDNGLLTLTALDDGYSAEVLVSGTSTSLSHAWTGGGGKTLTIHLATDTHGEPISTAADVVAEVAADIIGKLTAVAGGTGLGLAGAKSVTALPWGSSAAVTVDGTPTDRYLMQARIERGGSLGSCTLKFAADEPNPEGRSKFGSANASFWFLAKRSGLSVVLVQQTGNDKTLSHTFASGVLAINLGTNSTGDPSTTASALLAYLKLYPQLVAAFRFGLEVGDGSGIMDAADLVRLAAPALNWSGELLIPANGRVHLRDSKLDTGIIFVFTGSPVAGETWVADSSLPLSSTAAMMEAIDAIRADNAHVGGIVVLANSLDLSGGSQFDAELQDALQAKQLIGICPVRGIAEGVADETVSAWKNAIILEWLGFVSVHGLLTKVGGEYIHIDGYTGRNMRRYGSYAAAGRAAAMPYHQDLSKTLSAPGSGAIRRCLGLYFDEKAMPGLYDQRFVTLEHPDERPGAAYFTASPTCADESDPGYALLSYIRTMLVGLRTAKLTLYSVRGTSFPTISAPDETGAPAGALTVAAAESLETFGGDAIQKEYERLKSDGESSTSPLAEGEKYLQILRTNNFGSDQTIYFRVNCRVKTPAYYLSIEGNVIIPS